MVLVGVNLYNRDSGSNMPRLASHGPPYGVVVTSIDHGCYLLVRTAEPWMTSIAWDAVADRDVIEIAEQWLHQGRRIAIATVVETWGSAPRPVGSQLVVDDAGAFEGSVSGGCVEGAVIAEAADVIASGHSRVMSFGVADETAWQVGLSCGGRIAVYVEAIS
ncbi:XdhC and CoxI family protein [Kaistia soli DSM 19436]|uniref:XdhC and CoxI family protein n=2 Tax=Kaistia TaxID=166953 RepID=A0A1M5AF90_9HYPH|nr:XdhC and CoxI family protein [Kaistia soli DSM 19436]